MSLDVNGFAIRGTGAFAAPFSAVSSSSRKRTKIHNGSITGFTLALNFRGTAQFVTLERLFINATTTSGGQTVLGVAAVIGQTLASQALIRGVQAEGQIQLTCPGLVIDTLADGGVVELNVPDDGSGVSFPSVCKGENVTN